MTDPTDAQLESLYKATVTHNHASALRSVFHEGRLFGLREAQELVKQTMAPAPAPATSPTPVEATPAETTVTSTATPEPKV